MHSSMHHKRRKIAAAPVVVKDSRTRLLAHKTNAWFWKHTLFLASPAMVNVTRHCLHLNAPFLQENIFTESAINIHS